MYKAEVYSKHNMARISPKKVAIVMDMVRGRDLEEAKVLLAFDPSKAARMVLKVVKSAEANAVNNRSLNADTLYLADVYVNGARMYKWGKAGTKGRFNPMLKRNSHIVVGLSAKQTVKKEGLKEKILKTTKKSSKVKEVKE